MSNLFLFAVTNSVGKMYEVSSKGLKEIKDSKSLNSRGAVCLIYEEPIGGSKTKSEYVNVGVHDITLTDSEIHRENHVKFQAPVFNKIFPLKTKKAVFKLSFSIKKEVLDRLFFEYEFSKIVPLSVLLWNQGKGIHGVVSEKLSFFKIVQKDYRDCLDIIEISELIYSEEYNGNLDKDNLTVLNTIYQTNSDVTEDETVFFNNLLEKIDEDYFDEFNVKNKDLKTFLKNIENTDFYIKDTVSAFYHSKIYKPFLIFGVLILSAVAGIFFFLNTKNIAQNYLLTNQLENIKSTISQQKKTINILSAENYYPYLIEPEIKETIVEIHKKLQENIVLEKIKDIKIEVFSPGKVFIDFKVDEYEEYVKVENILKSNKNFIFKSQKTNKEYIFELEYNLNEEAKKAKVNRNSNNKIIKRR